MQILLQDLKHALRQLRKTPGFTLVAVLTLALGIGANTAIFSVMNAVVLRYLPVPDPQQLVFLQVSDVPSHVSQTGNWTTSFTEYSFEQLRQRTDVFSDLMAYVPLGIPRTVVRYGDDPEEAQGDMVSGNFFSGLGVRMVRGRGFTVGEEKKHAQVAVLGYGYWTRRFSRNPSVLGQTLYVKGVPFTIIGVAPPEFAGVEADTVTDLWIPLQDRPELTAWGQPAQGETLYGSPNWWTLMMIGRLKAGVSQQQALARLNPSFHELAYYGIGAKPKDEKFPDIYFASAQGIGTGRDSVEQPLMMLMAMVGLVLVIACGNVAMLLLARNAVREREFSLRMSLGASRGRLLRQLLSESLLLVAAGTALGWGLALWATSALARWSEIDTNVAPDMKVLGFTLVISIAAALVFGLAPLRSAVGAPVMLAIKTAAAASVQDRSKARVSRVVVALQMSMCLVLLVGATLLVRSMRNLQNANLGFSPRGLLVFGLTPPQTAKTDAQIIQFFQTVLDHVRSLPGVESATLMERRIGSGWANNTTAFVDGARPDKSSSMRWNTVGPDYFHVLNSNLLLGRDFTDADTAAAPPAVIVNHTFAERYLGGRSPIGHSVAFSDKPDSKQYTIVGVVADSRYTTVRESPRPMSYFPYTQIRGIGTMHVEVRTAGDPVALLPDVRRAVHALGPDLALLQPMSQYDQFAESYSAERLYAKLSLCFGVLAVMLVASGLFATLAYRVSRRTAEIGVRMALGAQRGQVLWMVLREALILCGLGVAVGLPLAVVAGRLLKRTLFGIGTADPLSFFLAVSTVAVIALLASAVPARRASSVDPMVALRYE